MEEGILSLASDVLVRSNAEKSLLHIMIKKYFVLNTDYQINEKIQIYNIENIANSLELFSPLAPINFRTSYCVNYLFYAI